MSPSVVYLRTILHFHTNLFYIFASFQFCHFAILPFCHFAILPFCTFALSHMRMCACEHIKISISMQVCDNADVYTNMCPSIWHTIWARCKHTWPRETPVNTDDCMGVWDDDVIVIQHGDDEWILMCLPPFSRSARWQIGCPQLCVAPVRGSRLW